MEKVILTLICCIMLLPLQLTARPDNPPINVEDEWDKSEDGDRSLSSSPFLFKDTNFVYVYSEKELVNLTIGITDMQGNTYHYEVTTVPAGLYYAISIESLPAGQYYLCIYQRSNYVIGIFTVY